MGIVTTEHLSGTQAQNIHTKTNKWLIALKQVVIAQTKREKSSCFDK